MVGLSFELTKAEAQSSPASEKVTKHGTVTIQSSGGVGGGAYATGWKIGSNYLRYTHGDYSVAISKEHRTFIAWLAVYGAIVLCVCMCQLRSDLFWILYLCTGTKARKQSTSRASGAVVFPFSATPLAP